MTDISRVAGRQHCPIPTCAAHSSTGHAGWDSWADLRAHMDAHQLGGLPGLPPVEWLRAKDLVACPECSRLVSRRCNGGVHSTGHAWLRGFFAARLQHPWLKVPQPQLLGKCWPAYQHWTKSSLRLFPHETLLAQICFPWQRRSFFDAWPGSCKPTARMHGTTWALWPTLKPIAIAAWTWTELLMFPKTWLGVLPGAEPSSVETKT